MPFGVSPERSNHERDSSLREVDEADQASEIQVATDLSPLRGGAIDLSAPSRSRESWSLDHLVSVENGGAHPTIRPIAHRHTCPATGVRARASSDRSLHPYPPRTYSPRVGPAPGTGDVGVVNCARSDPALCIDLWIPSIASVLASRSTHRLQRPHPCVIAYPHRRRCAQVDLLVDAPPQQMTPITDEVAVTYSTRAHPTCWQCSTTWIDPTVQCAVQCVTHTCVRSPCVCVPPTPSGEEGAPPPIHTTLVRCIDSFTCVCT